MGTQPLPQPNMGQGLLRYYISQQQTAPHALLSIQDTKTAPLPLAASTTSPTRKKRIRMRGLAIGLVVSLVLVLFFIWQSANGTASVPTTRQGGSIAATVQSTPAAASTPTAGDTNITIRVYIAGAVKRPGVYAVAPDARVYDLLRMAGGTLPGANLITLNLAAKLSDGQEVYVALLDETPPALTESTSSSASGNNSSSVSPTETGRININTASAAELQQQLHVSAKIAQKIVAYRVQHGPFTSVDQLSEVVSQRTLAKIKDLVFIS